MHWYYHANISHGKAANRAVQPTALARRGAGPARPDAAVLGWADAHVADLAAGEQAREWWRGDRGAGWAGGERPVPPLWATYLQVVVACFFGARSRSKGKVGRTLRAS